MDKNYQKKIEYRTWAKDLRSKLDIKSISLAIESKIKKLDVYKSAKIVMSYMAKEIEISLSHLFQDGTKSWYLPVVGTLHATSLLVAPYVPDKTKLSKNKYGISEPEIIKDDFFDQNKNKVKLDIIFVPGLCFDKKNYRLGFGKGYYDNFLKLNPESIKIGCCPKECLVEELPIDDWDIKMDMVITE
ncbi:MAG: 5-formyltetrahydrofolate cyclo-ligase [Candidatus Melainabacteria bacterium RIFCSPHIGHO2_02_FULL_34_12]|nr:MAG: 5-formyltetrahydrofolate cyclo-ligase [Candidatus Melainabacteria bacterium RIFCSPHIGHO2_02_FULL_34_12]